VGARPSRARSPVPTWYLAQNKPVVARSKKRRSSPSNDRVSDGSDGSAVPHLNEQHYLGEIFCNRSLKMRSIKAIGFDMDYTLAHYKADTFETLAYEGALRRLVHAGYPREILDELRPYDPQAYIRGLVIDKKRGNILKMDRHKYVKLAFHGFQRLSKQERDALYNPAAVNWAAFNEPDFAVVDTLFSLPDAFLFSKLVEFKDQYPNLIEKPYEQIYRDVRRAVDLCHRDGTIKRRVAEEPAKYIEYDPHLIPTLKRLKRSGRKTFLLTNSLWEYTNVVMNFLMGNPPGLLELDWLDLFDVVIVGANKPAFLTDPRLWMYRVDPRSKEGYLSNTEGVIDGNAEAFLREGKVLQGGNYTHLQEILSLNSGSEVLYVGDHMFSDILRSKRQLGWRTMLIIPELTDEINEMLRSEVDRQRLRDMRLLRDELDEMIDRAEWELHCEYERSEHEADPHADPSRRQRIEALRQSVETAETELREVKAALAAETERYHRRFHPVWGQLFKTGYQNSRFAEQVEQYACLYTSRVSNLRFVSPEITFRCMSDQCPHDRLHESPMRRILERRLQVVQNVSDLDAASS
jgi:HAD superfamily 5'-nucleotidase-like hydrolase